MAESIDIRISIVNAKSISDTKKELKSLGKAGAKAGKKIEKGAKKSSNAFQVFSGVVTGTAVISVFRGIASAVIDLGKSFIQQASQIERFTTQFEVLTGSVASADKLLRQLQEFSAKTPFQLPGIAASAKVLLAFGFQANNITNLLGEIGDVAAISGKPLKDLAVIFGQIQVSGKLTAERFNQLVEAGVNVGPEISKILNINEKAIRSAITLGKVSSDVFRKAFKALSSEGGIAFEGMIKQSKTLEGVLSTLGDNFSLISADIGKLLIPFVKSLSLVTIAMAQDFRDAFKENLPLIQNFIKGIKRIGTFVSENILDIKEFGIAASIAFDILKGPLGFLVEGLFDIGKLFFRIIANANGMQEVFKRAAASMLEFSADALEALLEIEKGFRKVVVNIALFIAKLVTSALVDIRILAAGLDLVFGSQFTSKIDGFIKAVNETIISFKKTDGALKETALSARIYAGALRQSADQQEQARLADEKRIATLKALNLEIKKIRLTIKENGGIESAEQKASIERIQKQIDDINGIEEKNNKGKKIRELTREELILKVSKDFAEKQKNLRATINASSNEEEIKANEELSKSLRAERVSRLETLRNEAVSKNDFINAQLAQEELQEQESANKKIEIEKNKIEEINAIQLEQEELKEEKKIIEAELEITKNEVDREFLLTKLEEIEQIEEEFRVRKVELEGTSLEALRAQTKANNIKVDKENKVASDNDIRRRKASAQVRLQLEKTTLTNLADIGDSLRTLGIAKGKTAAKIVKGIKTTEAIISGALAVQNALSSAPPPFNFLIAAAVGLKAAVNVKTIQDAKFSHGGIAFAQPGQSRTRDVIPALLRNNEQILTPEDPFHIDNRRNTLRGLNGSSNNNNDLMESVRSLSEDVRTLANSVNGLTGRAVTVEIDGKEIVRTIANERAGGFT